MGEFCDVPISVSEQEGRPVRFTWRGRMYTVRRIVDYWVTLRSDWDPETHEQPPGRVHWRVEAGSDTSRGVYELRHEEPSGQWHVARVAG